MKRPDPLQWGEPDKVMREAVRKSHPQWVKWGWIIESMETPILWLRWGDAESTHEIPLPMKPTTLEACLERYAQVKLGYERDTRGPWAIEKDRIRNVFTEECIPCAILV